MHEVVKEPGPPAQIRSIFIMEQHLGHQAYYQNLRQGIEQAAPSGTSWVEVTYQEPASLWERMPLLPEGVRGMLSGRRQVRRGLRQHPEADVVFFNTQVPAALAGGLARQRPYVLATDITPRQYDVMGWAYNHSPDRDGLLSRYKHAVNRQLFQRAARILPWSNWARDSLIADYGVDPARIEVVSPSVDLQRWRPGLPRQDGKVRILFVGGDFYRKGGQPLLEAYRTLDSSKVELIAVTRTALPAERGVTVHSHIQPNSQELQQLYQSCDIFVLPTRAEAFGIAAVEASASGLPVIATRVGGLPDIVQHEKTGFFIEPDNVEELAGCLGRLVDDAPLRRQLGQAAREHATRNFDIYKNSARILAILAEAARLRSAGLARQHRQQPNWDESSTRHTG
jgi:glycosyltransferase involved in cell wall biosynthesis